MLKTTFYQVALYITCYHYTIRLFILFSVLSVSIFLPAIIISCKPIGITTSVRWTIVTSQCFLSCSQFIHSAIGSVFSYISVDSFHNLSERIWALPKSSSCSICFHYLYIWWSVRDSNPWPSTCKADALANWANTPNIYYFYSYYLFPIKVVDFLTSNIL